MHDGAAGPDRDRVIAATDLVEIVGERVELTKRGREWVGLCPFHDDRNPSFAVVTHKREPFFKCFSCGAGGSAIDFVMLTHKLDFAGALRELAQRAGVPLTPWRGGDGAPPPPRAPRKPNPMPKTSETAAAAEETFETARAAADHWRNKCGREAGGWVYHNADGEPVGGVLRFDPARGRKRKIFLPITRNCSGWVCLAMPAPRPLYRLHKLRAADPAAPVIVTEGERKADIAVRMGFVATTPAGGAQAPRESDWKPLAGRAVVIVPDHDKAGEAFAAEVAELAHGAGAASVRLVRLWNAWPKMPAKGDLVEWFAHHNGDAAAAREAFEQELARSPEIPRGDAGAEVACKPTQAGGSDSAGDAGAEELAKELAEERGDLEELDRWEPFPLDALPEPLRSLAAEGARAVNCDPALFAVGMLPILAALIGNARVVELKRGSTGWTEPPILWAAIVAHSGAAKSPAMDYLLQPLGRIERRRAAEHAAAAEDHDRLVEEHKQAEREHKQRRQRYADRSPPPAPPPAKPTAKRLLVGDATPEVLDQLLAENPRGLLCIRDELGALLFGFGKYRSGGGRGGGGEAQWWLEAYGGRPGFRDRVTSGPRRIPRKAISIAGGIQPETLRLALTPEHRANGLAARLLITNPPVRAKYWTEDELAEEIAGAYREVCERLLALEPDRGPDGEEIPRALKLSAGGKAAWVRRHDELEGAKRLMEPDLAAVQAKLIGAMARIALVLHLVRDAAGDPTLANPAAIDAETIEAAARIVRWFGREARRFENWREVIESGDEAGRERREFEDSIRAMGGSCTERELTHRNRRYAGGVGKGMMETAVREGRGRWETLAASPKGGRPSRRFYLGAEGAAAGDAGEDRQGAPELPEAPELSEEFETPEAAAVPAGAKVEVWV